MLELENLAREVLETLITGVKIEEEKTLLSILREILGKENLDEATANKYFTPLIDGKRASWSDAVQLGEVPVILPRCAGGY